MQDGILLVSERAAAPAFTRLQDAANINASLDMMAADPTFKWQHECIVRPDEDGCYGWAAAVPHSATPSISAM